MIFMSMKGIELSRWLGLVLLLEMCGIVEAQNSNADPEDIDYVAEHLAEAAMNCIIEDGNV